MAAATFQREIPQGHLMAFRSHRPESRVETQLVLDSASGAWSSTGHGDTGSAQGLESPTESLSHLTLGCPHASLQRGRGSENSSPVSALLCHVTPMKGDNAIEFYKSMLWLEFCSWLPT